MPFPWLPLLVAFATALIATPVAAMAATTLGWVDRPSVRKVHGRAVPYLGGGAVMVGLAAGLVVAWSRAEGGGLPPAIPWPGVAMLGGAVLMFVVGLLDDTRDLRPRHKLAGQLLAALLVVGTGTFVNGIQLTESVYIDLGVFGPVLSVLWIVGVTNAVNIIDGLDGLAAGITVVAASALGAAALALGRPEAAVIAILLAGAALGYLPYNSHPARIFLGDAGSLTIGFLLASLALFLPAGAPTSGALGVGLAALGIPILDTAFAMVRRVLVGRSILSADRNHIHHRCIAMGWGHQGTMCALAGATALGGGLAVANLRVDTSGLGGLPLVVLAAYAILFRTVGAIRMRDAYRATLSLASAARTAADERQRLDHVELELMAASQIEDWWAALGRVAENLGFDALELELPRREGSPMRLTLGPLLDEGSCAADRVEVLLPIRQRRGHNRIPLRARTLPNTNLEELGRQVAALSRVLERYDLSRLPGSNRKGINRLPNARLEPLGSCLNSAVAARSGHDGT
jgi:UDP-GlcNAc:undecaprenyl-phosphate GlcNAc-1-phosphate transferase